MTQRQSDVLILGAGVIGLACAHYLLQAGRSVTVLEQGKVGGGASHGNCGTITPSHAPPLAMPGMIARALRLMWQADASFYIKPRLDFALLGWLLRFSQRCNWRDFNTVSKIKAELLNQSHDRLAELIASHHLQCEFEIKGTLGVFRDAQAFERSQWLPKALSECGIATEIVDGRQARVMEPALNDSIVAGYFNPGDAHLRPDRYVEALAGLVRSEGAQIQESTRVTGFDVSGGRIVAVTTENGKFNSTDVVLALGAWSPKIGKLLGLNIPLQPGKGYSITYDRPTLCPSLPLILKERAVCVTSWSSGYRLGSTMEFSGYDTSLNRVRLDALTRAAAEYLQEPIGATVQEEWYGWRPMTYDDLPIIGRVPRIANLALATGHGMLGVSLSAITGVLISELLTGKPASLNLAPFDPRRFA